MNMLRTLMFIDPGRRVPVDTGETVGGRGGEGRVRTEKNGTARVGPATSPESQRAVRTDHRACGHSELQES